MSVLKRVLLSTCEGSSMKVLPRIVGAQTSFQRILWSLTLLLGLGAASYQLTKLLIGYLDYSTSVNIVEVNGWPPFPDVTVCHLDRLWTLRRLQGELGDEVNFKYYIIKIMKLQRQYEPSSLEYKQLEEIKSFHGYLQNVHRIHEEAKHWKDLFILDCNIAIDWEPWPCSKHSNITAFLDPYYGFCVTFHIWDSAVRGLYVMLYMENPDESEPTQFNFDDTTTTHTSTVGARVVIHPQKSFPDILYSSHYVYVGQDVGFNIKGMKHTVLDEPYGDCVSSSEAVTAQKMRVPGYYFNRHGYECYRMCAKDHVKAKCGCLHLHYASTDFDRANNTLCGYLEQNNTAATVSRLQCAWNTIEDIANDMKTFCPCTIPCEQFIYDYSTKTAEWPDDKYHLSFYEQYIRSSAFAETFHVYEDLLELSHNNSTEAQKKVSQVDLIKRNFAQIRVLNHQTTYMHYSETPLMSLESFFGNMGGLLDLWVGITFIAFMEIIEFLYQLCTKCKEDKDKDPPQHV